MRKSKLRCCSVCGEPITDRDYILVGHANGKDIHIHVGCDPEKYKGMTATLHFWE
jgi:hypothetical protein